MGAGLMGVAEGDVRGAQAGQSLHQPQAAGLQEQLPIALSLAARSFSAWLAWIFHKPMHCFKPLASVWPSDESPDTGACVLSSLRSGRLTAAEAVPARPDAAVGKVQSSLNSMLFVSCFLE